jgi:hypothetical protein
VRAAVVDVLQRLARAADARFRSRPDASGTCCATEDAVAP